MGGWGGSLRKRDSDGVLQPKEPNTAGVHTRSILWWRFVLTMDANTLPGLSRPDSPCLNTEASAHSTIRAQSMHKEKQQNNPAAFRS